VLLRIRGRAVAMAKWLLPVPAADDNNVILLRDEGAGGPLMTGVSARAKSSMSFADDNLA